MVDAFLLIFVLVIIGAAFFANVKVLMYYQQPEDSGFGSSIFCKGIIVFSLTLAWMLNILLPVDVRNSRPRPGVIDMKVVWTTAFFTLAAFVVLVVPAAMFYTEVEGDDVIKKKRRYVCCNMFILLFFVVAAIALSYPFLANASMPVFEYSCDQWQDGDDVVPPSQVGLSACSGFEETHLEMKVGFDVYIIAVMCFVGWLFFVVFGGIGLSAVPLDLILEYTDRPKPIDEQMYQQRRRLLGQAASLLMVQADSLQGKDCDLANSKGWRAGREKRAVRADYNKFKRDVMLLETEFERLKISKFHKGENLAVSIAKLTMGILCAIMSIMWVLHIILVVVVPQLDPGSDIQFLDAIFSACEGSGLYPLGVALFAVFTLYLLACVVKGCLKFGMRIFFLFSIHPMRHQSTPLNSILFNVEMVLITSAAVCQFSQTAFRDYARLTDAEVIFSAQVKYMSFYSFFFKNNIFIWALLGFFVLALIYLLVKPRDNADFRPDMKADKQLARIIGVKSLGLPGKKDKKNKRDKDLDEAAAALAYCAGGSLDVLLMPPVHRQPWLQHEAGGELSAGSPQTS
eukprot:CAMPEP_0183419728 /NCGR_PEP_ID=MMETSP0370-20130417/25978_1 /TAXON_ID=268820 /ORGANISM="Peridinium aciculiferum, Strain PAER-2" /LENGTH=569 /DNA_ID=CAMNT_0025603559 /DNA_START=23 /DNA_END=1730 /DNA_ORIENTATION=+